MAKDMCSWGSRYSIVEMIDRQGHDVVVTIHTTILYTLVQDKLPQIR